MRIRIIIILYFVVGCNINFYAQSNTNFGFGANAGYKSPSSEAGFVIEYKLKKIIDFYGGLSYGKYNGFGYTFGTEVYALNKQWQPYVGVSYNHQFGDRFYIGQTGVNRTDFKVNPSGGFISSIGIRWIVLFDDKTANGFMTFSPYVSYRHFFSSHEVIYESGTINEDAELKINNRIGNGLGFGVKLLYFINRNRDKN